jgi:hypothetical protein
MFKPKQKIIEINSTVNKSGELVLSSVYNGRLIKRKFLYYSEEEARERFLKWLKFTI